jgi:Ca-activated chloride channel family protein
MNFEYSSVLPFSLIIFVILFILNYRSEKDFFTWIKDHWFLEKNKRARISLITFWLSIFFMVLALHDLRGKEVLLEGNKSDQRTILLVDTSASMGAEDVRPTRFEKAILLARHFIKRAPGHKISIVVFSDYTKRIVPFTEDSDLIDARLQSLKTLNLNRGGTALSEAINESVNYFVSNDGSKLGNIVVLTDGENQVDSSLNIPEDVSVAFIGIGTAKGGPVPIRDNRGIFRGNKKFNGSEVVSRLDENYFKQIKEEHPNTDYWIVSSYSLPTSSILNYLQSQHRNKLEKNKTRIKPVMMEWLMIPAILLMIISSLLRFSNLLKLAFIILAFVPNIQAYANEKEIQPTEKQLELEERMRSGEVGDNLRKSLVQEYMKSGDTESAEKLLGEVIKGRKINKENANLYFNKGTLQLQNKNLKGSVKTYQDLLNFADKNNLNKDFKNKIAQNLLKALQVQKQQQQSQGEGESKEKNKSESQSKDGQGKGQNKDQKDKKDQKSKDSKDKDKGQSDKKQQDKKQDKKDSEGEDKQQNEKNEKGEQDKNKSKIEKKKLPSMLKQLISDDNKLQKTMIDNETKENQRTDKKDW